MTDYELTPELHVDYSEPDTTAPPWADVVRVLTDSEMFWLSTVRHDGRPHVTPLPAIWLDGALHFCCGSLEQKAKNLEANRHVVVTTGTPDIRSGLDVIVEGDAERVTDTALLERLAAVWKSKLDWDFQVEDDHFGDPDGRHGLVFGVQPTKVLAFGKNPYTQTRYRGVSEP